MAIDDHSTPTADVLRSLISIRRPGQVVPVEIYRDGKYETIDMRLGAAYHYVTQNERGQTVLNLEYVAGSETMTESQIRRWIARNGKGQG